MRALDVMTPDVITISSEATVQQVASLLVERHISAVPVVDDRGRMVGIVSEGDLMRRAELGTERRRSWWLEFISSNRGLAADYVKSHARKVSDVMTTDVISIVEAMPVTDVADLLESRHIKRVPVLRDGKPVGIVSRANLIQALVAMAGSNPADANTDDQIIRSRLLDELRQQRWSAASPANVVVQDGVIHLWGYVLSEQERHALRVAAENIPGVKGVEDHTLETPIAPMG